MDVDQEIKIGDIIEVETDTEKYSGCIIKASPENGGWINYDLCDEVSGEVLTLAIRVRMDKDGEL